VSDLNDRADPRGTGVWQPQQRRLTAGIVLMVSLTAFEALAVATILPAAIGDIGGVRFYGWAFSSFMLANLVGIQMAGEAADRHGAQRPFFVGCLFFSCGLVLAGLSRGPWTFIVGRLLQGAGAGAVSASVYVAVARGYSSATQPRMLAVLASAWVIPGMVGPAVAGGIAHLFGWRAVFLSLLPLTVAALVLAAPPLRTLTASGESSAASKTGPALALALGVGLALVATEGESARFVWLLLVVGLVIAAFALQRLVPKGTLRAEPGLPAAIASLAVMSAAFFGAEAYVPLALTAVRAQSTFVAGVTLTAATLCWTTGTWIQERWVAHTTHRRLTLIGMTLIIVGIAGTASVLSPSTIVGLAPVTWGIAGMGMGIAFPTATLVALGSAPEGREGEASAAMQLANVLGMAVGTGVGGALFGFATASGYSTAIAIALVETCGVVTGILGLGAAFRLASVKRS
jgi:MFS family permease